ncbi:MAG TPA: Ig-like domain-containing protein [Gemmatimonadales bacterium]|nr:Ig-like domain-containing protein [Gemmatimonadales bacterium]
MADIVERLKRATLGEFEIGRELGRGGMAAVFLAHEISLDRKVAIKVMSPGLMMGDGMVERFKHEAITIAQLHHPHIVSVYSVRQAEGLHFFVMRYVQGRSLEHVVQRAGRLPLPLVRSILHQVGSALTYAHRSRVVHRDVKPGNILIDQDGNAVVTDFGIAKAAERPSRTLTGALVGTPAYMSPEQCGGGEVSGASDQYSLGAVLYELVTGVPPFDGSTLTVMQAHVERSPRPLREHCSDCPPEVEAAILRMLDKDPAARWPRLTDAMAALGAAPLAEDDPLRAELTRWVSTEGGASLSGTPTPTSPAPRTRASAAGAASGRPVGGISIMPAPTDLEAGDSFSLVAVIRGEHGTRLPPRAVRWTTDAPEVLRLDGTGGIATAVAPGTAIITATCKEVSARLRVEVAHPRADDIVIEPMSEPLHMGDEIRLEATPKDKRGWPVYRPVTWHSGDTAVAAVTPHGTIAGLAPGTVRITAALDDARASIVIPVLPPRVVAVDIVDPPTSVVAGRTFVLTATPLDHANNPLPRRAVVWSTSDVTVALATSEGWVAALRPGAVVLTATCEGVRASVRIGVVPESLPLPPAPEPESRHASYRRSRRARRRSVLAALTAGAAGLVWLAVRPGTVADHRAGGSDRPGSAGYAAGGVGIDTAAPSHVAITSRPTRALRPDSTVRLVAEVKDAAGRTVAGAPVAWSSGDSTVARVDRSSGQVVAVRPGRVQVVAASGAGRDSVVITVRRRGARVPLVSALAITPPRPLRAGDTATLGAVVLGAKGDTLQGAEITWSSSDAGVATVEALTGEARGIAPGTARIEAHSGTQVALADLTVVPGGAAALQILGARPMAVREILDLRVLARDGQGQELPGVTVGWTTSDSSVAAVDESTGTVTARAPGSARITARAEGASAWILLSVLPRPEPLGTAEPDGGRQRTEAQLQAGVTACYDALRARDVGRLRALWHATSKAEEDRLRRLSRILATSGWSAIVGDRVDGGSSVGLESAAMEFSVPLSWTEPTGRRVSHPDFRAEFALNAGRWELSSCRVVGSPSF